MRNEEGREGGKRLALFTGGGDRGLFALQILLSSFLQHIPFPPTTAKFLGDFLNNVQCCDELGFTRFAYCRQYFDARRLLIPNLQ
jgi:hypothetical protein